jgi:hypothetical protein
MTNAIETFDITRTYAVGDVYRVEVTPAHTVYMQVTEVNADGRPVVGIEIPVDRAMEIMAGAPNAAHAVAVAYHEYTTQTSIRDAADFIENALRGTKLELCPGIVVTVSSVTNAGFNGMQVGGYTADDEYRIACFR